VGSSSVALPTDTVANAADAFLACATATTTRRSYGQTMSALTKTYGDRPLEALDGPAVAELAADNWGDAGAGHLTGTSPRCARSPARTPASGDVCPVTGRGRLSYERAEYLFKRHSRRISRTAG